MTAEPIAAHAERDEQGAGLAGVRDDAGSSLIVGLALGAVALGLLFVLYLGGLGT